MLECEKNTPIEKVHQSTYAIDTILEKDLTDIVPSYQSIAIFSSLPFREIIQKLSSANQQVAGSEQNKAPVVLPICYEFGLDLEVISEHAGLKPEEVIRLHLEGEYRSLFIGFTPGFVYADGLNPRLACPRKSDPRAHIPGGSVGIGGDQTGIYSLKSPGGWNIIGRTPVTLFDPWKNPPMYIHVGTPYSFRRITKKEFEEWEN
ncbi:MAG: 5-oxoprolinase subunit B [Ekhidna sp.]